VLFDDFAQLPGERLCLPVDDIDSGACGVIFPFVTRTPPGVVDLGRGIETLRKLLGIDSGISDSTNT